MVDVKVMTISSLVFLVASAGILFLSFGLGLNTLTSPAWQVAAFHLLLVSFSLGLYAAAAYLLFPRVLHWKLYALLLGAMTAMAVMALGWTQGWMVLGFRGDGLGDALALFAVLSSLAVIPFWLVCRSRRLGFIS